MSSTRSGSGAAHRPLELHPDVPEKEAFSLGVAQWLGFDLDHTLIRYRLDAFLPFVYRIAIEQLVQIQGYEPELCGYEYCAEFGKKGVVIDKVTGIAVKLDDAARVVRAFLGRRLLSESEVRAVYGSEPLPGFAGHTTERYYVVHTYFEVPVLCAFATVVHHRLAARNVATLAASEFTTIVDDLYRSLNYNYGCWTTGLYFGEFARRIADFVEPAAELREWLGTMRKEGFKLFLITNSLPEYTWLLLSFAYGPDWRALFDLVIFRGAKPGFWTSAAPFAEITFSETERDARGVPIVARAPLSTETLRPATEALYEGGSWPVLKATFAQWPSAEHVSAADAATPAVVAYFGDHLAYDCAASRALGWRAVGIVEEIESDRHLEDAPPTVWHCFFTFGHAGEEVVAHGAARHGFTYWKRMMDASTDAVLPSMRALCGLHHETILNASGAFWHGSASESTE